MKNIEYWVSFGNPNSPSLPQEKIGFELQIGDYVNISSKSEINNTNYCARVQCRYLCMVSNRFIFYLGERNSSKVNISK